jgi:hypothetical protein
VYSTTVHRVSVNCSLVLCIYTQVPCWVALLGRVTSVPESRYLCHAFKCAKEYWIILSAILAITLPYSSARQTTHWKTWSLQLIVRACLAVAVESRGPYTSFSRRTVQMYLYFATSLHAMMSGNDYKPYSIRFACDLQRSCS